jgi:hypothetical protein
VLLHDGEQPGPEISAVEQDRPEHVGLGPVPVGERRFGHLGHRAGTIGAEPGDRRRWDSSTRMSTNRRRWSGEKEGKDQVVMTTAARSSSRPPLVPVMTASSRRDYLRLTDGTGELAVGVVVAGAVLVVVAGAAVVLVVAGASVVVVAGFVVEVTGGRVVVVAVGRVVVVAGASVVVVAGFVVEVVPVGVGLGVGLGLPALTVSAGAVVVDVATAAATGKAAGRGTKLGRLDPGPGFAAGNPNGRADGFPGAAVVVDVVLLALWAGAS